MTIQFAKFDTPMFNYINWGRKHNKINKLRWKNTFDPKTEIG